jgi:hypothetical protein
MASMILIPKAGPEGSSRKTSENRLNATEGRLDGIHLTPFEDKIPYGTEGRRTACHQMQVIDAYEQNICNDSVGVYLIDLVAYLNALRAQKDDESGVKQGLVQFPEAEKNSSSTVKYT